MRIAVYSGTFNPLHIGHKAIMEYLIAGRRFDGVYLVVSPQNPLKHNISPESGRQRYDAAVEALGRHPELDNVRVDDIELTMEPPHYTIKTLDALKRREPDNEFTLIIGADNLYNIHRWRDFPRILAEYGVAVYPRKGFDLKSLKKALMEECALIPSYYVLDAEDSDAGKLSLEDSRNRIYDIHLLDAPIVDISSTEIREAQTVGKDMSLWLM